MHEYLDEGERALVAGNQNPAARDTAQGEALAVLLGGGKKNYDEGYRKLLAIRKRQAKEYVQRNPISRVRGALREWARAA